MVVHFTPTRREKCQQDLSVCPVGALQSVSITQSLSLSRQMFGKLREHQLHVPKGEMLVLFLVYEVGTAKQDKLPRKGWCGVWERWSVTAQAGSRMVGIARQPHVEAAVPRTGRLLYPPPVPRVTCMLLSCLLPGLAGLPP